MFKSIRKSEKTIEIDGQPITDFQEFSDGNNKFYIFIFDGAKIVYAPHGIFPSHQILADVDMYIGSAFSENDKICVLNGRSHLFFGKNNQSTEILKIAPDIEIIWIDLKGNNIASLAKSDDVFKAKIYLKPQEKPPKGLEIKRGPRGGLYYESKISIAPKIVPKKISKLPEEHIQSLAKHIQQIKIPEKFDAEDPDRLELHDGILDEIQKIGNFSDKTRYSVEKVFSRWDDFGYQSAGMSPLWVAASQENERKGFPASIDNYVQKHHINENVIKFLRYYIQSTKLLMRRKFGDGSITVYRGVKTKNHEKLRETLLKDEDAMIPCRALESWSPDKHYAEGYADEPHTFILKTTIHAADVGLIGVFTTPIACSYMDTNEYTLNTSKDKIQVSLVYDADRDRPWDGKYNALLELKHSNKITKDEYNKRIANLKLQYPSFAEYCKEEEITEKKAKERREKKEKEERKTKPWLNELDALYANSALSDEEFERKRLNLRRKYPGYDEYCIRERVEEPLK